MILVPDWYDLAIYHLWHFFKTSNKVASFFVDIFISAAVTGRVSIWICDMTLHDGPLAVSVTGSRESMSAFRCLLDLRSSSV